METYNIIGTTNGYIAQRDNDFKGRCEITLESDLTLDDAITKLNKFFEYDYEYSHDELIIGFDENDSPIYAIDNRWTDYSDGTASYEHDSRFYKIIKNNNNENNENN